MEIYSDNVNDDIVLNGLTNYQSLNIVKQQKKNTKLIADIIYDSKKGLLEYEFFRRKFIENIIKLMIKWNFDGIFLRLDYDTLSSHTFNMFLDEWKNTVEESFSKLNGKQLQIILRINTNWISQFKNYLLTLSSKVDKLFITMPNPTLTSKDVTLKHIDPLYPSSQIPEYETLSSTISEANKIYNVSKSKIIVGLNIWARGYNLINDTLFSHGSTHKYTFLKSKETGLYNGYYTYPEICNIKNDTIDYNKYNFGSKNVLDGENEKISFSKNETTVDGSFLENTESTSSIETTAVPLNDKVITKRETHETENVTEPISSLIFDVDSQTTSFFGTDGYYYQYVDPEHEAFLNKIRWVSNNGYGGVGLTNMEGDDSENVCGKGRYPIHKTVSSMIDIIKSEAKIGGNQCTRICKVSPSNIVGDFFKHMEISYCSHISIEDIIFNHVGDLKISDEVIKFLEDYKNWEVDVKPYVMLTIGSKISSVSWRTLLLNIFYKEKFIKNIVHFCEINGINHINIAWTSEKFTSNYDGTLLNKFLIYLRKALGDEKEIFCSITPHNLYNNFYKIEEMVTPVDYFILEAHKFRDIYDSKTSHHSTLLFESDLLEKKQLSADAFANDFIGRRINPETIIIEFSAAGQVVEMQNNGVRAADIDNFLGLPVVQESNLLRNIKKLLISQNEICEIVKKNETIKKFVKGMEVPYLIEGNNFISYDNEKSTRIKAIWVSVSRFAGISIKNIEMDNTEGTCPSMNPFPILKTFSETQICNKCKVDLSNSKATLYDSMKEFDVQNDENLDTNKTQKSCAEKYGKLKTICTYRLPLKKDKFPLVPDKIPFSKCDELLIDDILILPHGNLTFRDDYAKSTASRLGRLMTRVEGVPVRAVFTCFMPKISFDTLLDEPEKLTKTIISHLKEYNLQGLELRCHNSISKTMKTKYGEFIEMLRKNIIEEFKSNPCSRVISVSLPSWGENVPQLYDVNILNNLDYLSLDVNNEISSMMRSESDEDKKNDVVLMEQTIQSLERAGIDMKKVLLNVPIYARSLIKESNITEESLLGENKKMKMRKIEQKVLCKELKRTGYVRKISYESVIGRAVLPNNEEVSFETQNTLFYKLKYVMKEKLGGIVFNSLNDDDFSNECNQGMYSLLMSTKEALCQK
uniref:Glyco_18 domain-containing protein n=1 Tax=Parastrongyloides trichosuri TaxID=131310 RepID=A0A0N4ZDI2_PARTI